MKKSNKIIVFIVSVIAILMLAVIIYFKIAEQQESEYTWVGDSYDKAVKILFRKFQHRYSSVRRRTGFSG